MLVCHFRCLCGASCSVELLYTTAFYNTLDVSVINTSTCNEKYLHNVTFTINYSITGPEIGFWIHSVLEFEDHHYPPAESPHFYILFLPSKPFAINVVPVFRCKSSFKVKGQKRSTPPLHRAWLQASFSSFKVVKVEIHIPYHTDIPKS